MKFFRTDVRIGNINGTFLNEGLIDEYHHLLLPVVDGGRDMTGVFEINDDVLWLTYDLRQGC